MPQQFSRLPPLGAIFLSAPPLTWNPGSAPESRQEIRKPNNLKVFGIKKIKDRNRRAKIGQCYIRLQEMNPSFYNIGLRIQIQFFHLSEWVSVADLQMSNISITSTRQQVAFDHMDVSHDDDDVCLVLDEHA